MLRALGPFNFLGTDSYSLPGISPPCSTEYSQRTRSGASRVSEHVHESWEEMRDSEREKESETEEKEE